MATKKNEETKNNEITCVCNTCVYKDVNAATKLYICRRYPTPKFINNVNGDWCGEWKADKE